MWPSYRTTNQPKEKFLDAKTGQTYSLERKCYFPTEYPYTTFITLRENSSFCKMNQFVQFGIITWIRVFFQIVLLVGFLLLAFVLPLARSRDPRLMQSYSNLFTFNSKMKDFTKFVCANRISFSYLQWLGSVWPFGLLVPSARRARISDFWHSFVTRGTCNKSWFCTKFSWPIANC